MTEVIRYKYIYFQSIMLSFFSCCYCAFCFVQFGSCTFNKTSNSSKFTTLMKHCQLSKSDGPATQLDLFNITLTFHVVVVIASEHRFWFICSPFILMNIIFGNIFDIRFYLFIHFSWCSNWIFFYIWCINRIHIYVSNWNITTQLHMCIDITERYVCVHVTEVNEWGTVKISVEQHKNWNE